MQNFRLLSDEWLLRLLIRDGLLDETAATYIRESGSAFASSELIRSGLLSKEQIAQAVWLNYNIPYAEPAADALNQMALQLVPESLCRRHLIFPLRLSAEHIELLMANPSDTVAPDAVASVTGRKLVPFFGLPEKVEELIDLGYNSDKTITEILEKLPEAPTVVCIDEAEEDGMAKPSSISAGAPVIHLANLIIGQAVRMKASDIHIEHTESSTLVRYRVDGVLRNMMVIPKHIGAGPLVSRIKIMADLDLADRRRPQDGRAKLRVGQEEVGLRVSTMPTAFGEKTVLRILDQRSAEIPLETLGFGPEILERLVRLSKLEQGLLLVTGPTGSGKTTTLYSLLNRLKSEDINIVTVEDPIEYQLAGINQVQVNDKAGMSFASVLRSVLRQDPDVVLVGEIRDRETADIAFQAALTGHMVLSTLHTNDALATVSRLLDMGVERYKMAPALIGVASQRLVRRICPACKSEVHPSDAAAGLQARRFKGKGCELCDFTGLSGRIAVTELLDLSELRARELLNAADDIAVFREAALENGWLKTMAEDALWHLANGDAPFEEVRAYIEPAKMQEAPAPPPAAAAAFPSAATVVAALKDAPRKLLIVDDNPDNRLLIRDILKTDGYGISEAANGRIALDAVVKDPPDLMLLDLMMPEMNGFEVVRRLRSEMGLMNLPVMVLTALGEAESQTMALELGADDYLSKPLIPKVLRARVKALFRRRECIQMPAMAAAAAF